MEKQGNRKPSRVKILLFIGAGLLLMTALFVVSLQLLTPQGWSQDVASDDGRMNLRVQFKAEPDQPEVGMQTLLLRVKDVAGFPMRVDHVHFTISKNGQNVAGPMEGEPVGNFKATGDGYFTAQAELMSSGVYQVDVLVQHNQSSFNYTRPHEVERRR